MKLPTTISFLPVTIGLVFTSCSGEAPDTGIVLPNYEDDAGVVCEYKDPAMCLDAGTD